MSFPSRRAPRASSRLLAPGRAGETVRTRGMVSILTAMLSGLDMGGSSLKVVSIEGTNVLSSARIPHAARGLEAVLSVLARALPEGPSGVAVAGLVRGGVVLRSGNLGLEDAPLRDALEARTGRKI